MKRFYARLCWNSEGWRGPTREVKDFKLEQPNSYALSHGFGHEEWLFDFTDILDGYQYGFLQPVEKGSSFQGQTVNLVLYALNPVGKRVLIAEVSRVKILTSEQQEYAFAAGKKSGRIERMRNELKELNVDQSHLWTDNGPFNIRFKRQNVRFQESPYPELVPQSHFKNLKRYFMFPALPGSVKFERSILEPGVGGLPDSRSHMRKAILSVMVRDRHLQLQRALRDLLIQRFGSQYVFVERDGLDLCVHKGNRRMLIEIKSDSNVKHVLREALGQVIEYAHWPTRMVGYNELFIVSPAAETKESQRYLTSLRNKYKLPVTYCTFAVGDILPDPLR